MKGSVIPLDVQKSTVPFPTSSWECVLKLLGLIIIADNKILEEEIAAFLKTVTELRAVIDLKIYFTEKMAIDWFELNKPALEEITDSRSYDMTLREILEPIADIPQKLDVISAMVKIAVSDGEYCDLEKDLIKKTCLYWHVRSNFQHNLEYLFAPNDGPKLIESLKGHPGYDRVSKTYR